MPFHPRATAATAAALAVGAVCTACTLLPPSRPAPAHPTAGPTTSVPVVPGWAALLPIGTTQLQAAAALAARFTTAYTTHRPGEPPRAWLARLRPMATAQLAASLARAAPWQAAHTTTGQASTEKIRDLTPSSVIFTIETHETATAGARRTSLTHAYAVTVARQPGGGWAVYDIEPATAGNTG
jgi:hypothetical protein